MKPELLADDEYNSVSDPVVLSQLRNQPASMMPLSSNSMLHQIDRWRASTTVSRT